MKTGRNLQELAAEIMRQSGAKHDYIVPAQHISATRMGLDRAPTLFVNGAGDELFNVNQHTHGQIAEKTGIAKAYYDRLLGESDSDLWERNVNHWFRKSDARHMVRTLDGSARALLSDRYQRIDHEHVAETTLPALLERSDVQVVSCEVTERRLYIKAVVTSLLRDVKVGDPVRAGVIIGNSEIGDGSLYVDPWIERLRCTNGMVVAEYKWRRAHVGSRLELPEGVVLAEDTMRAEDSAILLKMRDMIRAATSEVMLDKIVAKLRDAADTEPVKSPQAAVQLLAKTVGLLQGEQESVLERLIQGRDYTLYGMANAVTNLANDAESYDRATELEKIGGNIITLPRSDWQRVAGAELRQAA
jgi:succinate dehydrogenase flavin-adding protein (antitoxin of CptAB toxin-antitoxin module)